MQMPRCTKAMCIFKLRRSPQVPPPNCPLLTNVGLDHVVSEERGAAGVTQANGLETTFQ